MINSNNRVFGLDVLRALAVLFVVYGHGYYLVAWAVPEKIYYLIVFDGVTFFFVLSGFLIGRILLRTLARDDFNGKMLIEFWIRRWFRTLPNYLLVLTFIVISSFYLLDNPQSALLRKPEYENLLRYFFFSQNIASPHPKFFPEAWSLTIEEWFYLVIPIPLYLATKLKHINQKQLILCYIIVVIFMVIAFRIYRVHIFNYSTTADWDLSLRKQVVTRIDSLMFGVLGAYISLYKTRFWNNNANKLFVVGMLFIFFDKTVSYTFDSYYLFYLNYFSLTITPIGALLLLPKLSLWKQATGRLANVVTFISLTSYSMYLLNLTPVQGIILPVVMEYLSLFCWRCGQNTPLKYILYWIITVGGSFLLYQYFERPMTALREKWHIPNIKVVSVFSSANKRKKTDIKKVK